ncbi:MAG: ComF family protein [Bacteroidia bacterium]|nr:ComF family protein [Bacteroidia bacterium]
MKQIIRDFFHLFFPEVCMACGNSLYHGEKVLCTRCMLKLPRTHFHQHAENPVSQLFWGRAPIDYATSYFYFRKSSHVQHLLHQFKYKGKKEIGIFCGQMLGKALMESSFFCDADFLVPVPLHPKKQAQRGYNQSEVIARGMAGRMHAVVDVNTLYRKINSTTQTRKSRYQRFENMDGIFGLKDGYHFEGKHVILIDDVVTTGSTLESCTLTLLQIPAIRVSIATLACALL